MVREDVAPAVGLPPAGYTCVYHLAVTSIAGAASEDSYRRIRQLQAPNRAGEESRFWPLPDRNLNGQNENPIPPEMRLLFQLYRLLGLPGSGTNLK